MMKPEVKHVCCFHWSCPHIFLLGNLNPRQRGSSYMRGNTSFQVFTSR